jgi:hypothetical protein
MRYRHPLGLGVVIRPDAVVASARMRRLNPRRRRHPAKSGVISPRKAEIENIYRGCSAERGLSCFFRFAGEKNFNILCLRYSLSTIYIYI